MSKFKVGDIVEAFGLRGKVHSVDSESKYPIFVEWTKDSQDSFTADGRVMTHHITPSLVLVERPKNRVTKFLKHYVNVYSDGRLSKPYETEQEANMNATVGRVTCVAMTGAYEIEEE